MELKSGIKFSFTPTGKIFTLANVTEKRVSWYIPFEYMANKNKMRMAWISRKDFEEGINTGDYQLLEK